MCALVLMPHASPPMSAAAATATATAVAAAATATETTQLIIVLVCLDKDERVPHPRLLYGQLVAVNWTSTRPLVVVNTFVQKSSLHFRFN